MRELLLVIGRGIGQVMFQNNALSGLLMLAGLLLSSWQAAALAVAGNAVGTLTAHLLNYDRTALRNGLYGFNGTLVGIAVGVFMPLTPLTLLLMAVAAALSTLLARAFALWWRLPGFTAPFILAVWALLAACHAFMPAALLPAAPAAPEAAFSFPRAFALSIGQVMFQGTTALTALLFLAGILVHSVRSALLAVFGAALAVAAAWAAGADNAMLNAGLAGYNAVLAAMAFSGGWRQTLLPAAVAALLSTALQAAALRFGIVTLTAPFVVAVWLVQGAQALCRPGARGE